MLHKVVHIFTTAL